MVRKKIKRKKQTKTKLLVFSPFVYYYQRLPFLVKAMDSTVSQKICCVSSSFWNFSMGHNEDLFISLLFNSKQTIKIIIEYLCIRVIRFFMVNFLFIEYIYFLVLLFNNKKPLKNFFKIKVKIKNILNYMKGYYCKFIYFYFHSYYYQTLEWKQIIIIILHS